MLARAICERTLLEYSLLQFLPSELAAAAVYLTRLQGHHHQANKELKVPYGAAQCAKKGRFGTGAAEWEAVQFDKERLWTAKLEKFSGTLLFCFW